MILIIDYGMGNLGSVLNMFKKIGVKAKISSDLKEINEAKKILLPGVGSFDTAMKKINESGLLDVLNKKALIDKIPILGICLGMQLMTNSSEEGKLPGLGWIDAETINFKNTIQKKLKIPHMGWNTCSIVQENELVKNYEDEIKFYFVHSYYVKVNNEKNSLMKTNYDLEFDSAIIKNNLFGAQFHPEKSHKFGMNFFKNFAKI